MLMLQLRQTADTFQAAATFMDLCQIWGSLEPEIATKIKFAKYHALRIAKAIKAGEDPNLSNPASEPSPSVEQPPPGQDDPDVQMLDLPNVSNSSRDDARQPSVVEIPDEHDEMDQHLAQKAVYDESLHPSRAPSVSPQVTQNYQRPAQDLEENYYHSTAAPEVSPSAPSTSDRIMSDGGGYFPKVPEGNGSTTSSRLPEAPPQEPHSPPTSSLPDPSSFPHPSLAKPRYLPPQQPPATSLHSFPPPNMNESTLSALPPSSGPNSSYPSAPPPSSVPSYPSQPPPITPQPRQTHTELPLHAPDAPGRHPGTSNPVVTPQATSQGSYLNDEESVLKAQKHARWAVSALNFEDVNTAVKELRVALESLGAR